MSEAIEAMGRLEEKAHNAVDRIDAIYRKGWTVVGKRDAHAAINAALVEKDRRIAELEATIEERFTEALTAIDRELTAFHRDVLDVLTSVQNLKQAYEEISGWDPMRRREG